MAVGLSGVSGVAVVRPVAVDHKRACVLALIHPHLEVVLDVQEASIYNSLRCNRFL